VKRRENSLTLISCQVLQQSAGSGSANSACLEWLSARFAKKASEFGRNL
jgi:hypothetical protein